MQSHFASKSSPNISLHFLFSCIFVSLSEEDPKIPDDKPFTALDLASTGSTMFSAACGSFCVRSRTCYREIVKSSSWPLNFWSNKVIHLHKKLRQSILNLLQTWSLWNSSCRCAINAAVVLQVHPRSKLPALTQVFAFRVTEVWRFSKQQLASSLFDGTVYILSGDFL